MHKELRIIPIDQMKAYMIDLQFLEVTGQFFITLSRIHYLITLKSRPNQPHPMVF
jgi:hypothetical protein